MASTPTKTTTVKTVNNKTGVTTSKSTVVQGKSVTTTTTTTIGTAKTTSAPKTASSKSKVTGAASASVNAVWGGTWLTGPNASRPLCGPVAVANHLLAVTGIEASNAEMERLYRAAGGIGDSGVPMEFVFAAACDGFAGEKLATWDRVDHVSDAGVLLLSLPALHAVHAAAVRNGNVIAWGEEIPLAALHATPIAAWSLAWHGQENR